MKMIKQSCLFCMAVILMASCKPEKPKPNGGGTGGGQQSQQIQLITTGYLDKRFEGLATPYYWIDDTRYDLETGGSDYVIPNGIEKNGNDLYIAGGYWGTHPAHGEIYLPCYWKNGQKINLPVDDVEFSQMCAARDIVYINGAVYIKGYADWAPVLWKIKNGVATVIHFNKSPDGSYAHENGSDLVIHQNKIYFSGTIVRKQTNGSFLFEVGYWTIDAADNLVFNLIENQLGFARSYALAITSNGIFISGSIASNIGRADEKSVIWSTNGRIPVINLLNPATQRIYGMVSDAAGNLFVRLHDIQRNKPVFWKISANGQHREILPAIPAGAQGDSRALMTLGNTLAYTYTYESGGLHYTECIVGDKKIVLGAGTDAEIASGRIRLFPK